MIARRLVLVGGLGTLVGCASSPPVRLHLLAVEVDRPLQPPLGRPVVLGVGPIEVVDYLERPEIVTRRGRTGLDLAESDRWGERFEVMLARTLRESLARLLATDAVVELPSDRALEPELRLELQVLRFEAEAAAETTARPDRVVLEARWLVLPGAGDRSLRLERSTLEEPIEGEGAEAAVAAMSRALGGLARILAEAVRAELARRTARPATRRTSP